MSVSLPSLQNLTLSVVGAVIASSLFLSAALSSAPIL